MSNKVQFWRHLLGIDPREIAAEAQRFEAEGWDGGIMVDSHCLVPEVWSTLTLCAERTRTLMLTTGATNPITRHPSVTAASAATLQLVSNGRAALGIARGDSALATLGAAPVKIGKFEQYLSIIQSYLRGETVSLATAAELVVDAPHDFESIAVGTGPVGSQLGWLKQSNQPKVPLEVFATGPKAIEVGARTAERVILAVGVDLNRLRWGIEVAHAAAKAAGREIQIGAFLPVVPHPDQAVARRLASPLAGTTGRFSVMNKKVVGPTTPRQRELLEKLAQQYDFNAHGKIGAHSSVMDDEFIDQFAVAGPPSYCIDRIQEIMSLGIVRFNVLNGSFMPGDEDSALSKKLLSSEVLPALIR
jgi:5,10-methylenetetrahydromethanopterin reductase